MAGQSRVLSGMRPTGRLHIGHYFGALQNWVKMQEQYDCFYFVADWHALTSDYADTSQVAQNSVEIGIDWLAAGLDPGKCTMFVQSQVPEHAELHLLLSMVTPLGWLERVPTYKEQLDNVKDKDLHTYGFLGYPLLQTADIVMYGRPDADLFVPVGEDQAPHVELAREIVRRFNAAFAPVDWQGASVKALADFEVRVALSLPPEAKAQLMEYMHTARADTARGRTDAFHQLDRLFRRLFALDHRLSVLANAEVSLNRVLQEPQVLLTETPRLPGTDGRKMSKSYKNDISLGEDDASIRIKARNMMTDPARKRRTDKGNPEVCPVFSWHKLFSPPETIAWSNQGCRTAEIGCIECKTAMADNLVKWIEPIRTRRKDYEAHPARVLEILDAGSRKAQQVAVETMSRVREVVFASETLRKEIQSGASKPSAAGG